MSIGSVTARAQRFAEAQMTETCRVEYQSGTGAQDPVTLQETPTYTTRFTSKCRVQRGGLVDQEAQVGGRTAAIGRPSIHLPVSSAAVSPGDYVVITAVGSLADTQLLGKRYRVVSPVAKSYASARRFEVEEVLS